MGKLGKKKGVERDLVAPRPALWGKMVTPSWAASEPGVEGQLPGRVGEGVPPRPVDHVRIEKRR